MFDRCLPPLIEYNIARLEESLGGAMDQLVGFALWCIAQQCAFEGLGTKFGAVFVRDVDKSLTTEDAEAGDVWLVAAPGLFRCLVFESTSGSNVVNVNCILQGIIPVHFGELCIEEHGSDLVKEGPVHALGNTIVLWGVGSRNLMFDPLLFEVRLDTASGVLTPSVGAKDLGRHAHFHFGS
jgi:hypothetical protein